MLAGLHKDNGFARFCARVPEWAGRRERGGVKWLTIRG